MTETVKHQPGAKLTFAPGFFMSVILPFLLLTLPVTASILLVAQGDLALITNQLILWFMLAIALYLSQVKIKLDHCSVTPQHPLAKVLNTTNIRANNSLASNSLSICLLVWWLWLGISCLLSPLHFVSTLSFFILSALPISFFIGKLLSDYTQAWTLFIKALLALSMMLSLYALYQGLTLNLAPSASFVMKNTFAAFLNLVLFVSLGCFFSMITGASTTAPENKVGKTLRAQYGVIFLLVLTIAFVNSLAAIICCLIGFIFFTYWSNKYLTKKQKISLWLLLIIAMLLGNALADFATYQKLLLMLGQTPGNSSAHIRLLIWTHCLPLVKHLPWHGYGPGSFQYYFPAYQARIDDTVGAYAHNDLLQLLLELGWPGFILTLGLALIIFKKIIKLDKSNPANAGVACALLTMLGHSMVSFNFYVLPMLVLFGLLLAKLDAATLYSPKLANTPALSLSAKPYLGLFIIIIPIVLNSAMAIKVYYYQAGRAAYLKQDLKHAEINFEKANRLYQSADSELGLAFTYLAVLKVADNSANRQTLIKVSAQAINKAAELNVMDPNVYLAKAMLYQYAPELNKNQQTINNAYQKTLWLKPRYTKARLNYAKWLLANNKSQQAYQVLDYALHSYQMASPALVEMLDLLIKHATELGEQNKVNRLNQIKRHLDEG